MIRVCFTQNLQRHVACPEVEVDGQTNATLRDTLNTVFNDYPKLRSYVVDDQGELRTHMTIFIDNEPILDRVGLTDATPDGSEVYVMQALSGG